MEDQILNDPHVFPTNEVLKKALGRSFSTFEALVNTIKNDQYGLTTEWRYYKDGKAWLCKACHKKKTIFWLSVWDKYFKTTFYFTEKTGAGISDLTINKELKEIFKRSKPIGRLIPLTIDIKDKDQLNDLFKIVAYKMKLR